MPPFLCTSGGKQFKPKQTLLLNPFCYSPALLEQGLQASAQPGGSLPFVGSSWPHGLGQAWPGDQPGLASWGRLAGSSQVEEVATFPPELVLPGAWLEALPSVGAALPPQRLVEAGTPLHSVPRLPPPKTVTFASCTFASDTISIYVVPSVLGVKYLGRDLL